MRNWALFSIAIVVGATGCGGAGGGSSSGGAGGGGGVVPASGPRVLLESKPGQLELSFLTGQGRSTFAPGDTQASVEVPDFVDSRGVIVRPPLDAPLRLQLNGYQNSIFRLNADVSTLTEAETGRPLNSRLFQSYELSVTSILSEGFDSSFESSDIRGIPSVGYPINTRLFPGRYSNLQLFVNDAMFSVETDVDSGTSFYQFNEPEFQRANGLDLSPRISSSLSDYLTFDLRGMASADRPKLLTGRDAFRVFFSGDNYALASGLGYTDVPAGDQTNGEFNAVTRNDLDPDSAANNLIDGKFSLPGQLSLVPGVQGSTPGTYSLLQVNPSDPFLLSRITSLQGIWREHHKLVGNMPEAMAIAFPSSRDSEEQDVVLIRQTLERTGSTVTAARVTQLFYGVQNLNTGQVRLYPLRNLPTGSKVGEVFATVGDIKDRSGASTVSVQQARSATLSGLAIAGFPTSVPLVIYRY